jgi:hypothetical protein
MAARVAVVLSRHQQSGDLRQQRIEQGAPEYLRDVVRIITETGLCIYQVDLSSRLFWVPNSMTLMAGGIPLTDLTAEAFRDQMELAGPSPWVFPKPRAGPGIS